MGEQGCGGVLKGWIENKSKTNKNPLYFINLENLCQRAVFVAKSSDFKQFITDNSEGNEKQFIEKLAIFHLSATYRDKVLEILTESPVSIDQQLVNTYDALMNGKECLLKLHQHSKEDVVGTEALKNVPLRDEIEMLKILNATAEPCPNVVRLLGSSINAPVHMIIERTPKGSLLTYLQGLANPPEAEVMLKIALDICNAMIYLDGLNIIHRDLCANNCFVFMHEGNLLTKLGDFHLAIISYYGLKSPTGVQWKRNSVKSSKIEYSSNQFSARWMAVETIQFGEFSTASDVWSYGVLLSEIFTFGCKPYVNMPSGRSLDSDEAVREFVSTCTQLFSCHKRVWIMVEGRGS
jgi:serine/threonine protein kinase